MSKINYCLIIILSIFSHTGFADIKISSSYGMLLSTEEAKKVFSEVIIKGKESYPLQDISIPAPFRTELTGLSLVGDYNVYFNPGDSISDLTLEAKVSHISIRINRVTTNTVIQKNISGVNVQVFLKGFCENVEVISDSEARLVSPVTLRAQDGRLVANSAGIDIPQLPRWQVKTGQCRGPVGYAKALKEEILNLLSNEREIKKFIMSPIQEKIETVAEFVNARLFTNREISLSTSAQIILNPTSLKISEDKKTFVLMGTAKTNLKSDDSESLIVEDTIFEDRLLSANIAGIYFSQKWIRASLLKAQKLGYFKYDFTSSSVVGLKSLFSNRLYQFFLWPDLMNFSKNVNFLFKAILNGIDQISYKAINDGAIWYQFEGTGHIKTKAPVDSDSIDYGHFALDLKTLIWLKIYQGRAIAGMNQPKVNLNFSWNEAYVKMFKPSQYININYFRKKIQSMFQNEKYSVPLPQIEVSEGAIMQADEIIGDTDLVVLRYTTIDKKD